MNKKTLKFLDFEVRKVATEDRTYWFTASTPSRDRMGDIIVSEGWRTQDFLKTGGPILWGHDYYSLPIGRGKEVAVSPNGLDIKVEFQPSDLNPFAGQVERLVEGGWIRTGSVGFQVYKREPLNADDLKQRPEMKWGERLYGDLLEFSIVPVPANPEALAQKDFSDALARGFGLKQNEAQSRLLPYRDEKGNVSPRLLRASLALACGARGGVKIEDADPDAVKNHLMRMARENGVEVNLSGDLREAFRDVWHEEVLDLQHKAQSEEQDVIYKLIKGQKRKDLMAARDALNTILSLSEAENAPTKTVEEPQAGTETASLVKGIIDDLSSVTARLK